MKLHRDDIIGQNLFTALGNGWVEINGRRHEGSLLVLPQHLAAWRPASFEQLSAEDFRPVIDQAPKPMDARLFRPEPMGHLQAD